jgi:hypothetical protein
MASRTESNCQNAQRSTGPRSEAGKARSAKNALRHGLRSLLPVLPGECPEDWQAHRAGIVQSLAPVGPLESELAERVALCLWRMRRVTAYETGVTAVGLDEATEEVTEVPEKPAGSMLEIGFPEEPETDAERLQRARKNLRTNRCIMEARAARLALFREMPGLPEGAAVCGEVAHDLLEDVSFELPGAGSRPFDLDDREFLLGVGVPADEVHDAWNWTGWTAGRFRTALARMAARRGKSDPAKLAAKAIRRLEEELEAEREGVRDLEREVRRLGARVRECEARARQKRMLPEDGALDKIMRYEAHVTRQMTQTLHMLERLQARRAGEYVPPPAAADVSVDVTVTAAAAAEAPPLPVPDARPVGSFGKNGGGLRLLPGAGNGCH